MGCSFNTDTRGRSGPSVCGAAPRSTVLPHWFLSKKGFQLVHSRKGGLCHCRSGCGSGLYLSSTIRILGFTDHKNVTFLFNSVATSPTILKSLLTKIELRAIRFSAFQYNIAHIPGVDHVWADILSRCGTSGFVRQQLVLSSILLALVCPDVDPDFTWPTVPELQQLQVPSLADSPLSEAVIKLAPVAKNDHGLRVSTQGAVWIPHNAINIQLRICVIGHCGRGGHRGGDITIKNIQEQFVWQGMKADIEVFCHTCLHCQSTIGSLLVPRSMSHALYAGDPNEIIHFGLLYMDSTNAGIGFCLIIKGNATSFTWLEPCTAADAVAFLMRLVCLLRRRPDLGF